VVDLGSDGRLVMERDYAPGDVILDRYLIEAPIGSGGMAMVFRCKDLRLDVVVAVKVLRGAYQDKPDVVRRFLREAKVQARLQHPNVVHVTNVEDRPDLTMMVMEYMRGMTLAEFANAKGGLDEREALELLLPIADALAMAHEREVVHRDIKPSNIFLAEQGRRLLPKLIDFGVARELDASITTDSTLLGTLPFMSFELVQSARNASPASDVYAFGVTIFQVLTQRYPIEARTLQDYVFRLMEVDEVPALRTFFPAATEELNQIVARCLKKDASQRFAHAGQLLQALRTVPTVRKQTLPAMEVMTPELERRMLAERALVSGEGAEAALKAHYAVQRLLGETALCCVYQVKDAQGQALRVKQLKAEVAVDEATALAFVAAVERQGRIAENNPFVQAVVALHKAWLAFAAPYDEGGTLVEMIGRYGAFAAPYTVDVFILYADALRQVHREGTVHGHLHPQNLYMAQRPNGIVTPLLLDLGQRLQSRQAMGDLGALDAACVAPELEMNLSRANVQSDVYAFGMCMLMALLGHSPFQGTSAEAVWAEVQARGDGIDVARLLPGVPDAVAQLVGWCISPAPAQRYQNMEEVHRDLLAVRRILSGY